MNRSIWSGFSNDYHREPLRKNTECDVLVIGGGLAGVLCAAMLEQAGKRVTLAEGCTIGSGITKNTTAVITAQHDTPYSELERLHGTETAKAYLRAHLDAVGAFSEMCRSIDCDFETKPSYQYSLDRDLSAEAGVLRKLGFDAESTRNTGLPFEVASAIRFPDMAQFHPLKFLFAAAKPLKSVYEHTYIREIKGHTAYADGGRIAFGQAVVASHFPFINRTGGFFVKMYQERSCVVALQNAGDVAGTYIDDKPDGFYWRNYGDLLLLGKGDHRTGTKSNAFNELETAAARFYPNAKIVRRWANQDCVTLDGMPYIGRYGSLPDVYTLTGFNLWGMSGSMVGARILSDLLCNKKNGYADVFKTDRNMMRKQLWINLGETLANFVYPTVKRCPHLGCALKYNHCEHSWDCPCHGSRFEDDGTLIDNPATRDANIRL